MNLLLLTFVVLSTLQALSVSFFYCYIKCQVMAVSACLS